MLLFLDIETTGFELATENILEIAAVRWDGEKIIERFEVVLQLPAGKIISDEIIALTGITNEMCASEGVSLQEAQQKFKAFFKKDDIITGHNIQFDTGFLQKFEFFDQGFTPQEVDTFLLSLLVLGQREQSHSLEILSERFNLKHDDAHRAMSDVLANLDFYIELEKVYARNFSEEFQTFYSAPNMAKNFPERVFFEGIKNKTMEATNFEMAKFPEPKIFSDNKESSKEDFNKILLGKENIFLETMDGEKYLFDILESAKELGKKIAIFYPSNRKKEFFALGQKFSTDISFDIAREQSVDAQKWEKFLSKPELSRQDVIVATKIFRSKEMGDLPFVRFMGPEWKSAREIIGQESRDEYTADIIMLPYQEAPFVSDTYAKVFFNAEQLEDRILDCQRKKFFQKQTLEDLEEGEEKEKFSILLTGLATAIREVKGENIYSVQMPYKDVIRLNAYAKFSEDLQNLFDDICPKSIEPWKEFFSQSPSDNLVQMVELFSDNKLAIEQIDPFFEQLFTEFLSNENSNIFIGSVFPKENNKTLQFSFPLPEEKNFSLRTESKNYPEHCITPSFSRDATPQELAQYVMKFWDNNNIVVSVTSKKTVDGMKDFLREESEKKGIKIFTQQNGGSGKIMNMMKRFEKKVVIGVPRFLDGLNLDEENFSIVVVHKALFDHPKQPLVAAQRERFQNDFYEYSMPRASARLEKEFLRLAHYSNAVVIFGDGRMAGGSTYHSKFRNILPIDTVIEIA